MINSIPTVWRWRTLCWLRWLRGQSSAVQSTPALRHCKSGLAHHVIPRRRGWGRRESSNLHVSPRFLEGVGEAIATNPLIQHSWFVGRCRGTRLDAGPYVTLCDKEQRGLSGNIWSVRERYSTRVPVVCDPSSITTDNPHRPQRFNPLVPSLRSVIGGDEWRPRIIWCTIGASTLAKPF